MRIRKFIPKSCGALAALASFFMFLTVVEAGIYEKVNFQNADSLDLTAYLVRPDREGPYPAVVFLHGCGGMMYSGYVTSIYASWVQQLTAKGLAVLLVDSRGSRGLGPTCGKSKNRVRMYRERPKDAYAALAYLQAQDFILGDKIGVVGWSQGGGVVLLTIEHDSSGRPVPLPEHDFAVAAAFYPALCSDRIQSRPYTKIEPNSWSTKIPLLVLFGGSDNWTLLAPCVQFIETVQKRGNPVSITVFPGAYHGFDAPALKIMTLPKYKTVSGVIPIVGTHEESRNAALQQLPAFLSKYLLPEK
ncbi:MAG: dienelactone hydrolase [Sneathiella sp.]|nr:MAG: dienelactone hydrolase [Sneathiella sp.]